jgi:hypothetical protein
VTSVHVADQEPKLPRWASASEMVTKHCSLRVRCAVTGGVLGWTFVIWIGARVVEHGWRPSKKLAWRAVTHYLDQMNVAAESPT